MDPFSFAGSKDVDHPVSIRMFVPAAPRPAPLRQDTLGWNRMMRSFAANESDGCRMNLEGDEPPLKYSTLLDRADLRHVGSNTRCELPMPLDALQLAVNWLR